MPVSAWAGSTPRSPGLGVSAPKRVELGGVGPAVADGGAQIGEGDGRRADLALAAERSIARGQVRGSPLRAWRSARSSVVSCGARSDESPASSASASAPSLAFSAVTSPCMGSRPVEFEACCAASALSILPCSFCSISPICGVERRGVGDRAAFLGGLGERLQRLFELRNAGGQAGEVLRRLDLTLLQCLDAGIERAERLGVICRRGRSRFKLGQAALERRQVGRHCRAERDLFQATARPTTPIRPPSSPAARWVTKLLSRSGLVRGGGPFGRFGSDPLGVGWLRLRRRDPASGFVRRGIDGQLGRGAFDGLAPGACPPVLILVAERMCHYALTFNSQQIWRSLRGCRLGVQMSARTSSSRGRAATRICPGQRLHRLCYRLREAIANEIACLRYHVMPRHQGGEDRCRAWRHEDDAVERRRRSAGAKPLSGSRVRRNRPIKHGLPHA